MNAKTGGIAGNGKETEGDESQEGTKMGTVYDSGRLQEDGLWETRHWSLVWGLNPDDRLVVMPICLQKVRDELGFPVIDARK